jgi:excisionase family DNA binding protein
VPRTRRPPEGERLLSTTQVGDLLRVHYRTVARWCDAGRLGGTRTTGGHRRFREPEVRALLGGGDGERLLTPAEVAGMFRVDPKTVAGWADRGRVTCIRLPGGVRRYHARQFELMIRGEREGGQP